MWCCGPREGEEELYGQKEKRKEQKDEVRVVENGE